MKETKMPAGLAKKLTAIAAGMGRLEKDGNNTFMRYRYTSANEIRGALNPLMEQFGVCIVAEVLSVEYSDRIEKEREKEKVTTRCDVVLSYHITDTETGEGICIDFNGTANDTADKALDKAYTCSEKRMFKALFRVVSADEDDDKDGSNPPYVPQPPKGTPYKKTYQQAPENPHHPAPEKPNPAPAHMPEKQETPVPEKTAEDSTPNRDNYAKHFTKTLMPLFKNDRETYNAIDEDAKASRGKSLGEIAKTGSVGEMKAVLLAAKTAGKLPADIEI